MKFYRCKHCGNLVTFLDDSGVALQCCGEKMTEVVPGSTDAAAEKHVPVVTAEGDTIHVNVGSVPHPMLPEHYIRWIILEATDGYQVKHLVPGDKPAAEFKLSGGSEVLAAYAYCNLHSLWVNA